MSLFKNTFIHPKLLETALTHRSYLNEHKEACQSNERLEFLGDAVLELVVSSLLYEKYPVQPEGTLTAMRAKIVQTKTLARVARKLGLADEVKMSKGEIESAGKNNEGILADTLEAVIGAIYLDQGLEKATGFIKSYLFTNLQDILASEETVDYKSLFQEMVQAKKMPTPEYSIVSESGPDHQKTFVAAVLVAGRPVSKGVGKTKQTAEQQAAKLALEKFAKNR